MALKLRGARPDTAATDQPNAGTADASGAVTESGDTVTEIPVDELTWADDTVTAAPAADPAWELAMAATDTEMAAAATPAADPPAPDPTRTFVPAPAPAVPVTAVPKPAAEVAVPSPAPVRPPATADELAILIGRTVLAVHTGDEPIIVLDDGTLVSADSLTIRPPNTRTAAGADPSPAAGTAASGKLAGLRR
jgi:hypothetical protein